MMMNLGRTKSVPNNISLPRYVSRKQRWSALVLSKIKSMSLPLDYYSGRELLITGEKPMSDGQQRGPKLAVPRGYIAVYVGPNLHRYVIPTTYLSMPDFKALMERTAEEFGYDQEGGLAIPCEEEDFEDVLSKCMVVQQTLSRNRRKKPPLLKK